MNSPATDPRSVSDLFEAVFDADDEAAWNAVAALTWRGSEDVRDRAIDLTLSDDPVARGRGANILGELGIPERTYPEACFSAVLPLLADTVEAVVVDAVFALPKIDQLRAIAHIIPFAEHDAADVRHAVAFGLCGAETAAALQTLLKLMDDCDADVRDWATFGIGAQSDANSEQVRTALAKALSDENIDVRYEGIIGLARRRDVRSVPYLIPLLEEEPDDIFAREAAAELLGIDEDTAVTTADLIGGLRSLAA